MAEITSVPSAAQCSRVWCFSIPPGAFPVPVAVLAQISWAAASTGLPGSPLTPVGFPGSQAGGAVG